MEVGSAVFGIPVVIGEIVLTAQEVLIFQAGLRPGGVPGGVQVVVQAVQLHDVPGVTFAAAEAGDHAVVNTKFQQQPVQQHGITLADGGSVDQGRIGCVLKHVGAIVQIIVIVIDAAAHPVVYGFQGSIIVGGVGVQLIQQVRCRSIHLCFLLSGGVVADVVGVAHMIHAVIRIAGGTVGHIGILPAQIVALCRLACMRHGFLKEIVHQGIAVFRNRDLEGNGCSPLSHLLAQIRHGFLFGIAGNRFPRGIVGLGRRRRRVGMQGIDMELRNGLQLLIVRREDRQRRRGQTGKQHRKGKNQ